MRAINAASRDEQERICVLWLCAGLFLLRVVGQIEALLIAPAWLPSMEDWYSGLLPYPLLLPVQIVLLMIMAVITANQTLRSEDAPGRWRGYARGFAIVYFVAMALRLVIQLVRGAPDVIGAGAIPVAFHWVLALFLCVLGRPVAAPARAGTGSGAHPTAGGSYSR